MKLIEVENLSKSFILIRREPMSFRQNMREILKSMLAIHSTKTEEFWALKNISFQVQKGDCVGIVGHNGSGKTTLLRLIAGILKPTSGRIHINNTKVGLASLGMYFMPELTGRENIDFSIALNGQNPSKCGELRQNIINFAEIENFIDVPLKSYSSGMRARLGFSILVNLLPDILLLDEILAVGDVEFQQKCIEYLQFLNQQGQTILIVGHSPQLLEKICNRYILLEDGEIKMDGSFSDVFNKY
jgi:ABC-type polysaccharide/polyol phosphate transport system ATPase subunit